MSRETKNDRPDASLPMQRPESPQRNGKEDVICHRRSASDDEDGDHLAPAPSRDDAHRLGYGEDAVGRFPHPQFGMLPLPFPVGAIPFQNFCPGYGPLIQPMFYRERGSAGIDREHGDHAIADIQSRSLHNREENHDPSLGHQGKKENGSETDPGDHRLHTCGNAEYTDQSSNCSRDAVNGSWNSRIGAADATMNARSAFDCGAESRYENFKGKGLDPNRSHREAALMKFRLKRKDRCFEKKVNPDGSMHMLLFLYFFIFYFSFLDYRSFEWRMVDEAVSSLDIIRGDFFRVQVRYHSRKMLAEQRPRVKGQFVRQTVLDSSTAAAEADD